MQKSALPRRWSSTLALVLVASACAAEEGDEDTGADTDTSITSNTSPVTAATDPGTMTAPADDGDSSDTPGDDTGPGDDGASMTTAADDDGGSDSGGDDVIEDSGPADDGATTGAAGSTVFGTVSRSGAAAIAGGNDGIGIFYIGVLVECSQDAESVGGNGVMVDVSAQDTPAVWQIDDVPDGHYFLAGFLDDNGNADMNDPYADMGDLAAAEGFGPACLEITVAGDEVAAGQFVLNIAVPF